MNLILCNGSRIPAANKTCKLLPQVSTLTAAPSHSFIEDRSPVRPPHHTAPVQNQPSPLVPHRSTLAPSGARSVRQFQRLFAASRMPSSDEDYTAFLERANDTSGVSARTSSAGARTSSADHADHRGGFIASSVDRPVPTALNQVDVYYTSESDQRFEPVSLSLGQDTDLLTADLVKRLTGYNDIENVPLKSFDPRGEYKAVIDAVKEAGDGDAQVFRIALAGARCEYWVLGLDGSESKVVGMRAGAVES